MSQPSQPDPLQIFLSETPNIEIFKAQLILRKELSFSVPKRIREIHPCVKKYFLIFGNYWADFQSFDDHHHEGRQEGRARRGEGGRAAALCADRAAGRSRLYLIIVRTQPPGPRRSPAQLHKHIHLLKFTYNN